MSIPQIGNLPDPNRNVPAFLTTGAKRPQPSAQSRHPAMHLNIEPGSTLELDERIRLILERHLGDGLLQITDLRTGGPFQVIDDLTGASRMTDASWVEDMIREQRLRIVRDPGGAVVPSRTAVRDADPDPEAIIRRDPKALLKRFVVRALVARGAKRSDPDVAGHLARIFTPAVRAEWGPPPPPATARGWLAKFGGLDVRLVDVVDRTGQGARAPRLDPAMRGLVKEAARWHYTAEGYRLRDTEARIERRRITENAARLAAGGVEAPLAPVSRETVRRAILEIRCRDTLREKHGEDWVRRRFDVSGDPLRTMRLLQIGLMDDKLIDAVFCFDAATRLPVGRPWLTLVMDLHTRCILGWYVSYASPSTHSAVECIRRACLPKRIRADRLERWPVLGRIYGLLSEIIADNGSGYASASFQDSLADAGVVLRLAAVGTPTHRAVIERLFLTFEIMLTAKLPGYTMDIASMRDAGYDPAEHALLTTTEFEELVEEWVHLHHVTTHSGIGMQPARAWEISMGRFGINVLPDPRMLDVLMGESTMKRLTRNGVRVHGLDYRHPELVADLLDDLVGLEKVRDRNERSASATVKVRYNPANLAEVQVWNQRRRVYVALPCVRARYAAGLSIFQHEQLKAWAAKENRAFSSESEQLQARADLNDLILELAPDVVARERRAMARLLGSEAVARHSGERPTVIEADPRFDGLGPVIEVDPAAPERDDGHELPSRPASKREVQPAPSPLDPMIEDGGPSGPDDDWDDLDQWDQGGEDRA